MQACAVPRSQLYGWCLWEERGLMSMKVCPVWTVVELHAMRKCCSEALASECRHGSRPLRQVCVAVAG